MNIIKLIKEKYKNYKIAHKAIKNFKKCKKNHSIPIFRLKEYALLANIAKSHEDKYIKISKYEPDSYFEFDISGNFHIHITVYITKVLDKVGTFQRTLEVDMARISYRRSTSPTVIGHKFYASNSNSGEIIYRSQININSIENTSLTIFNDLTNAFIDLICDMVIDSLKLLKW